MASQDIRALSSAMKTTNKNIGNLRQDVQKSSNILNKILEVIQDFVKRIIEEFSRNRKTMILLSLWEHNAELESKGILIQEQEEIIDEKIRDLEEDVDNLDNRFERINKDTSSNYFNLLDNMDSHITNITEKYFMGRSANAVQKKAAPVYSLLDQYYIDCENIRRNGLEKSAGEAVKAIRDFIRCRENFINDINKFKVDKKIEERISYSLPYYRVKLSSYNKKTYLPGDVDIKYNSPRYTAHPELEGIKDTIQSRNDEDGTQRLNSGDISKLHAALTELFRDNVLNDSQGIDLEKELHNFIDSCSVKIGGIR